MCHNSLTWRVVNSKDMMVGPCGDASLQFTTHHVSKLSYFICPLALLFIPMDQIGSLFTWLHLIFKYLFSFDPKDGFPCGARLFSPRVRQGHYLHFVIYIVIQINDIVVLSLVVRFPCEFSTYLINARTQGPTKGGICILLEAKMWHNFDSGCNLMKL